MFIDSTGQTWDVSLDLPACRRVRDLVHVNLLTLALPQLLQQLADPVTLCEVIWAIVKPQADAAGVSLEDFLRRAAVDLAPITTELLTGPGGLADFFRRLGEPRNATELETIWTRLKALETLPPEKTAALIDRTVDWMIRQILSEQSGTAATSTPASPA